MSKKKSVIILALVFMVMTTSVFAARGYNTAGPTVQANTGFQRGNAFQQTRPVQAMGRTNTLGAQQPRRAIQQQTAMNQNMQAQMTQLREHWLSTGRQQVNDVASTQARMQQIRQRLLNEDCPLGLECPNIDGTNPQFANNASKGGGYGRTGANGNNRAWFLEKVGEVTE